MKTTNNLDLSGFQILNMLVQVLTSAPTPRGEGHVYYDSTTKAAYVYDGTAWIPTDARKATGIPNAALATNPLARANHTGTQTAATISDLKTVVVGYRLDEFAAPTSAVSLNGQKITNLAEPTAASDGATKNYVDNAVQQAAAGIDAKPSVRLATTANITLSGTQTIDGVAAVAGDRVLVKNQTTASANGVYVVAAGAWSRATDADQTGELTPGATWFVEEGTTNGKTSWRIENTGTITLGTTSITINQLNAATSYTAGDGIALTGSVFSAKTFAGSGITVTASGIGVDTAVVVRKYATSVGNGSLTSIAVTHNLGTQDVDVTVRLASTQEFVLVDWVATSANVVTLTFGTAPAANAYRVLVIG